MSIVPGTNEEGVATGILLTQTQTQRVDAIATSRQVSRAAVVRWAIDYYLEHSPDALPSGNN